MEVILEIQGLVKAFGGLMASNSIDFSLRKDEIKGLIGPNGAGKTTFYNLITGVYKPDSGKVFFMGEDITGMPPHKICRKGLVRTYQITSIFPKLTIFENVRLAAQIGFSGHISLFKTVMNFKDVINRVEHILSLIGLTDLRNQLAGEISQGDQRLLEVAIAIASNPKALLLDEPTAGLSARETGLFVEKIQHIFEEGIIKSIVLVEHDIEVVTGLAQTICVLNYGEVIMDGRTSDVCNNEKVQEVYLAGGKVDACS
jgi:branched-chain amino acid transport system ATP-binding protein